MHMKFHLKPHGLQCRPKTCKQNFFLAESDGETVVFVLSFVATEMIWFLRTHLFLYVFQRYGQGVMKYSNGDVYEGVFEYDLCSKFGKMTYKNGSVYEGNWDNGLVRMFVWKLRTPILIPFLLTVSVYSLKELTP